MKTKHVVALIFGGLCLVWFVWALFAWGKPAEFNRSISAADFMQLLEDRGLEVCSEGTLKLDTAPGFVAGKSLEVSQHCEIDRNPMKVSLLEFDSEASRNAAQQRVATTHRGGFGQHVAYTYGPYVLTVQGTRDIGDQLLLGRILKEARQ